jgi:hypothetical protein
MRFDLRSRLGRFAAVRAAVVRGFAAVPAATAATAAIATPAQARPATGTALEWEFEGISCSASSACTAAGNQENSSGETVPLAERWNGSSWTVQSAPAPTGAEDTYLYAVSCTSATACSAAGYDITTTYESLAEGWNGTSWALQSTAHP